MFSSSMDLLLISHVTPHTSTPPYTSSISSSSRSGRYAPPHYGFPPQIHSNRFPSAHIHSFSISAQKHDRVPYGSGSLDTRSKYFPLSRTYNIPTSCPQAQVKYNSLFCFIHPSIHFLIRFVVHHHRFIQSLNHSSTIVLRSTVQLIFCLSPLLLGHCCLGFHYAYLVNVGVTLT